MYNDVDDNGDKTLKQFTSPNAQYQNNINPIVNASWRRANENMKYVWTYICKDQMFILENANK